jgi:hypothetical protein
MTVKELREVLKGFPREAQNATVYIQNGYSEKKFVGIETVRQNKWVIEIVVKGAYS